MTEAISSYTLYGKDDKLIRVSETRDRSAVLIECQDGGVFLDYETFTAFFELKYKIDIKKPIPFKPDRGDAVPLDPIPAINQLLDDLRPAEELEGTF